MKLKQISIFLENSPGHLTKVCEAFALASINMKTISIAETKDFGVMRVIVDNPEAASEALSKAGIASKLIDVLALPVADKAGDFLRILNKAKSENLNVEYAYALSQNATTHMILRFNDMDKASEIFA